MSTEVNMIWPTLIDLDAIAGLGALVGSTATVRSETEISAGFPRNICFISSDNFSHSLKQRVNQVHYRSDHDQVTMKSTTHYTPWFEKIVFVHEAIGQSEWPNMVAEVIPRFFFEFPWKLRFNGLVVELRAKKSRQFSFKTLFGYFSSIKCQNKMVTFFKAHFISIFMTFFSMGVGHCQLDRMRSSARY